jgi:hypothetical protein
MRTSKQDLGDRGERAVHEHVKCPRCRRERHLTQLPKNFQCADLICKFCGFLAQVKAATLPEGSADRPQRVLGAAWEPQREQIMAGIFHDLFVVGFSPRQRLVRIDRIPAHVLQVSPEVFQPRAPLGPNAKRAGWRGFNYDLTKVPPIGIEQVYPGS